MTFMVDEKSLLSAAHHYGKVLLAAGGDIEEVIAAERVDSDTLGLFMQELVTMRAYDVDTQLAPLLEGFFLGLAAGRRESDVQDGG